MIMSFQETTGGVSGPSVRAQKETLVVIILMTKSDDLYSNHVSLNWTHLFSVVDAGWRMFTPIR